MAYDLYASPVPVSESRRDTMIGLRFATEAQALERACTLRKAGWHLYRIKGPDGFEMSQIVLEKYCDGRPGEAS